MLNDTGNTPGASAPASVLTALSGETPHKGERGKADAALARADQLIAILIEARARYTADTRDAACSLRTAALDASGALMRAAVHLDERVRQS